MHSSFTPNASRLHIALFGKRNSGKSSLINVLTGQDTALVSDTPGTTTDPVQKAMEIHGIGPCLFIDTPGFDDEGKLGNMRIERTWKAVEKTDIAILLCAGDASIEIPEDADFTEELHWLEHSKQKTFRLFCLSTRQIYEIPRITRYPNKSNFWESSSLGQCQREDRHRTDTPGDSGKTAGRLQSAKYHRQISNRRRPRLTGYATRYSGS